MLVAPIRTFGNHLGREQTSTGGQAAIFDAVAPEDKQNSPNRRDSGFGFRSPLGFSEILVTERPPLARRRSHEKGRNSGSGLVDHEMVAGVGAISDEMMQNASTTWLQFAIAS